MNLFKGSGGVLRLLTFLLFCQLTLFGVDAEIISVAVGVGASIGISAFLAGYQGIKCRLYECCDKDSVTGNVTGLEKSLSEKLYGQHLVLNTVVRAIRGHLKEENPKKALTLSFHGWTGGGKNYVATMIVENLYKLGLKSKYAHLFIAPVDFPHSKDINTYKTNLQNWIRGNVTQCARSLFIFDELDKMDDGMLDAITPFINHYEEVHGVDFRKSIFIFLSNTAGNDITTKTLEHWQKGGSRTDITLKEMEEVIYSAAFNEKGGLRFSRLISGHLIDHFIPFLPMERQHVELCIKDQFRWKKLGEPTEQQIKRILDTLQYFPKEIGVFSSSGCKRVAQKVELILEEDEELKEVWHDEL